MTFLVFHANADAAPARAKPQPPVQVSISPVQPWLESASIKPGEEVEFKVSIRSHVEASDIRVRTTLEGGAEHVSGKMLWSGKPGKIEETSGIIAVRAPRKGNGKIVAMVEVFSGEVLLYSTTSVYEMGIPAKAKPQQPGRVRKDRKGRGVVEYR